MLRFLLITTLMVLTKSEGQDFFQGEWRQVALLSNRDTQTALICDYVTFEVLNNLSEGNTISLILNNTLPISGKLVKSEDEVDAILNSPIVSYVKSISTGFYVFRKLTDNYLMMYWMEHPGEKNWTLMAKEVPTREELEKFVDSNEEFKDLYRAFVCNKEVLQNPPKELTLVKTTKPKV